MTICRVCYKTFPCEHTTAERHCVNCGEQETPDSTHLGWFDNDEGLHCNACGNDPLKRVRSKKR